MSTLVLLSGGLDSATLLRLEASRGAVAALFVDYGQRAARRERAAARSQCAARGLKLRCLDIPKLGRTLRAQQIQRPHIPLPHRNLVLLSIALSYGAHIGASRLGIAVTRDDDGSHPTAAPSFLAQFAALARDLQGLELVTPLAHLTKTQVVKQAHALGLEVASTYSCLLGYHRHCGVCPQCEKRRAAVRSAGLQEPRGFYRR